MGKPRHAVYQQFVRKYQELNQREHMDQYVVPLLMSSHPGCTMAEAVKLAEYLRDIHHQPEQVQDFYPTPSTLSTVMYYTVSIRGRCSRLRPARPAREGNAAGADAI